MEDVKPTPHLLGEAPSKTGDRYHQFPLSGPPARVLCTLAGIPPEPDGTTYGKWTWALYAHFATTNVFERYAQATPWSVPAARAQIARLDFMWEGAVIVCLGRRVHDAVLYHCGIPVERHGSRLSPDGYGAFYRWAPPDVSSNFGNGRKAPWVVAIPHPSGLNRLLNDPVERARCGKILNDARVLAASDGTVKPVPATPPPRPTPPTPSDRRPRR